ncbi:MAG: hypothetical protein R3Y09_13220 [Clostridia bacterium]
MKYNRLLANADKIYAISREKGVDISMAISMFIAENGIRDFAEENNEFTAVYAKYHDKDKTAKMRSVSKRYTDVKEEADAE